jgi:two-component system response regulator ResD
MDTGVSKKILLAEDDEFLSALIKNRLERENFEVKIVTNGDNVISTVKEFKPNLVLLDIILPGMLGFEILEEMQKDPVLKKLPFMVMSNLGQESDIKKAKDLGAVDYFIKAHVLIEDLIKSIKTFLAS